MGPLTHAAEVNALIFRHIREAQTGFNNISTRVADLMFA